jgi:hypothetical protein
MKELNYSDIPHTWAVCFQNDCPMAQQCLRYHAAQLLPADQKTHNTVLQTARNDESCQLYVADQPVKVAYGMTKLFSGLKPWVASDLRHQVEVVFGSLAQYYRYRGGRYPISPKQQALIADIFARNGLPTTLNFDRIEEKYYFSRMEN